MILFADGREFQIAGTVISDGTTVIPFSAITIGAKPNNFPLPTAGIVPPILYVELGIVDLGTVLTAMSLLDYNQLAIAESKRNQPSAITQQQTFTPLLQRAAQAITRRCGVCGSR
jgi:hypothetical protein